MSPIVKRKGEKFTLPSKYLLFILTILCTVLMLFTFATDLLDKPLGSIVGYVLIPFEKGIGEAGSWLSGRKDQLAQIKTLLEENQSLKEQVALLTEENTLLQQDKYELNKLRQLFELDEQYEEYHKVGARIISRDSGNWYSAFIIDKGTEQGLQEDMNVIAGGGLVGRISSVGPNWARVTAIISDNANVSGMTLATEDNLIVSGSLKGMNEGVIYFSKLVDSKGAVQAGDKIVTSDISDKFLPGILIGYVLTVSNDNNNLTKSGSLIPAVDFEHLSEVLVITDQKQTIEEK
ncbi:MAG: rod shape-determining protein MreC [Lachnospiraceae bacterium]|jgi:rod shape-determining protein MreC|nr:rod shape-determining protein MreC [Lachnospiraceae bacterium]MBR3509553.1 rod shape-determining protein MreC [Lachnospiraceae bacterium]MBR6150767.1 rod shape-determining protein MreC [Lachnospiraceae bacterium]